MEKDPWAVDSRGFGRHMRSLRKVRGLTQEALAERGGLSADTVRRLEAGSFSPSLKTLVSMSRGLELRLSTMVMSYEQGMIPIEREIADMLVGRSSDELEMLVKIMRVLFEELEARSRR